MPLVSDLNVLIKLVLLRGRPIIKESAMLKNINMKFDLDIMYAFVLCMLVVVFTLQSRDIKNLQTQIDELKIVVDQKFLPAMIFNENDFQVR
jgi:low affinity Fe/Cu permease